MKRPKRVVVVLVIATGALVVAAGAGGYAVGRMQDVPRGNTATFLPSHWSCRNLGSSVKCQSGDAFPNATLTTTRTGGITVKVHTLRDPQGGGLRRGYENGYPVYVFTAFR